MTKAEVEQLIQAALEPLQNEISELREKLSAISPQPPATVEAQRASFSQDSTLRAARAAPLPENPDPSPENPNPPLEPSANPERTDFQRFLQRGLEEEQVRYSEEAVSDKPAPKKGGWNPFRR
jgi:hypothetical protein